MSNEGAASDFRIPEPIESGLEVSRGGDPGNLSSSVEALFHSGFSTTDFIIAGVCLVLLLGVMLLPRRALIASLQAQFADYGRAKAAGNALYVLLVTLGISAVVGLLGNLFTSVRFLGPASVLNGILLSVFIASFRAARASRIKR
jgi:hypothetical protein